MEPKLKLTICLVTKGRHEYLTDALRSYEDFLRTGEVEILIIDNGSDSFSKKILCDWKLKHGSQVHYYRHENNEKIGTPFFWNVISAYQPEWILFPGDDDILVFDVFSQFKKAIKNNNSLNAFAASGQVVNSKGISTGEIRFPAIYGASTDIEKTALALFEPPFFWPCLFIKYSAVPENPIFSRFVFDWWLGLQLVLSGSIETSNNIGVKYRAHEMQESFQASTRRKNFEGFNMLLSIFDSDLFVNFLKKLNDAELSIFFNLCMEKKLLYGQPEYNMVLLHDLASAVIKHIKSNFIKFEIAEKFLSGFGIYTKTRDLETIFNGLELPYQDSLGNVAVIFSQNTCAALTRAGKYFRTEGFNKFTVGCEHSNIKSGLLKLNCGLLSKFDDDYVADQILVGIDKISENQGELNFVVSPFERKLISIYRKFKLFVPKLFAQYLYRLKEIVLRKNEN